LHPVGAAGEHGRHAPLDPLVPLVPPELPDVPPLLLALEKSGIDVPEEPEQAMTSPRTNVPITAEPVACFMETPIARS
jgi:hypothetical protein